MVKVTVTVDFEGKSYQTNVLADRNAKQEEIFQQALHQVQQQWRK